MTTENPSPEGVDPLLTVILKDATDARRWRVSEWTSKDANVALVQSNAAYEAVASLLSRNAELEAQNLILAKLTVGYVSERDALAAENKALREALNLYIKAGFGNSTDPYAQGEAYDAAIKSLNLARTPAATGDRT